MAIDAISILSSAKTRLCEHWDTTFDSLGNEIAQRASSPSSASSGYAIQILLLMCGN